MILPWGAQVTDINSSISSASDDHLSLGTLLLPLWSFNSIYISRKFRLNLSTCQGL